MLVAALLEYPVSLNKLDDSGLSALHILSSSHDVEVSCPIGSVTCLCN